MNGFFISGTDTNVGKTVTSAILAMHASTFVSSLHYQKPIQTGCDTDSDVKTVQQLVGFAKNISCTQGLGFKKPLSPHLAAHLEQTQINFAELVEKTKPGIRAGFNIVEGAGGLMVPINHNRLMIDLITALGLPCVLVARSSLGTINHTLLSIDALRAKNIPIFGVVMVGEYNAANLEAVRYYGKISNLLAIPMLPQVDHSQIVRIVQEKRSELNQFFLRDKS